MTHSVPAVLAVLAVFVVMVSLFAGVVHYYSTLPPPVPEPDFGAVYVVDVDRFNGVVTIANRHPRPVVAVFTLYLAVQTLPPDHRVTGFALWLHPGLNHVHLSPYVARLTGSYSPSHVDWSRSMVVVGNLTLRLERGSGLWHVAPQPVYRTYVFSGTGLHSMDGIGYATVYYGGAYDVLGVTTSLNTQMGYHRNVDPGSVTQIYVYTYNFTGYVCNNQTICVPNACGLPDPVWWCIHWDLCYRNDTSYYVRELKGEWYRCARETTQPVLYLGPPVELSSSYNATTHAFVELYPTGSPTIEVEDVAQAPSTWRDASATWVATTTCTYTYVEYQSTVTFTYSSACCPTCYGWWYCETERKCTQNTVKTRERTGNPCKEMLGQTWNCAYYSTFLYYNVTANETVKVRQAGNGAVVIDYEVLVVYNYIHWYDPNENDLYIRVVLSGSAVFTPPPVRMFVSVGYNETLESATASYTVVVRDFEARAWRPAGVPFTAPVLHSASATSEPSTVLPAIPTLGGGVATVKTYIVDARPRITLSYWTLEPVRLIRCNPAYDPVTGTRWCSDTVYIRIRAVLEIQPYITVTVRTSY